jgi:hypothetical protein
VLRWRHKGLRGAGALLGLLVALGPGAAAAGAAAPTIGDVWVFQVQTSTLRFSAEVNPGGKTSSYRFEYIPKAAYEQNVGGGNDGFSGASRLPLSGNTTISCTAPTTISPQLTGLTPGTAYRYRLVVQNADGSDTSPVQDFATHANAPFALPEGRGWEMVSSAQKNGGGITSAAEAGGGTLRAAMQGGGVAFASRASFAGGAGAAPFSQYLASRTSGGWQTQNITPALLSGAYEGAPYLGFSTDLARSFYLNPARCPMGDPCLPGYQLRENPSGFLTPSPADPGLFVAASQDLRHIVFAEAGELHLWSPPALPIDLNAIPLAAPNPQAAISDNADRLYYEGADANLHLREGAVTEQVDAVAGGGGSLEDATPDGAMALYSKAGHLWRYLAGTEASEDLTPSGGVTADSARISADGTRVLFASTTALETSEGTTYDNTELGSGDPTAQIYLLDTSAGTLRCVSCNPTHARPLGPSSVPGSAPGAGPFKPRVISADGSKVFFDTEDSLVLADVNLAPDVYRWAAQGSAGCTRPGGCVALISSGLAGTSSFVDASAGGSDAFFLTDRSLVGADPGAFDLYDARVGGGFPEPREPSPCIGDACQVVPPAPEDPVLTTVLSGPGNSPESYVKYGKRAKCPKGKRVKSVKGKDGKRVRKCVKAKAKPGKKRRVARKRGERR